MTDQAIARAVHVNSATLVMGPTGSGKSSLLATLAEYVWETYHQVSVLYSTDGGGFPDRAQALIRAGILWPVRLRTRDLADGSLSFETIARATQGWMPSVFNRQTGEMPQGVKMVPPVTEQYDMACPNGHPLKSVPFQSMLTAQLCPVCKVHTTKENMRVSKSARRTKGLEQIGAVMYDGLSSMTSWALSDMGQRSGRLELKGEEGAIGGKVNSGDMKWGSVTRSHIGFAQSRAEEWVLNSLGIPYLVVPPTFTALTLETVDEGGLSVRGPKLAGKAKTDEAGAWVGNCLETAVVRSEKDERIYRLYLSEFTDAGGVRHLVKHRGAPGTMPPHLEDPPITGDEAQTAFTQFNLGVFFTLLEAGLQSTIKTIGERYPDAPGAGVEGLTEIGEGVRITDTTHAPAPTATAGPSPVGIVPAAAAVPPTATSSATSAKPSIKPSAPPAPAGTSPSTAPKPRPRPQAAGQKSPTASAPASTPAPAGRPAQATAPLTEEAPEVPDATPSATAQTAQTAQTAPVAPVPQTTQASAGPKAWAPPGAPRPPAPAPRVGAGVRKP